MAVGLLSVIILFITHGTSSDQHVSSRFWASLLQNSIYFLLVVNAAMFFICATTLAWGSWQMAFRRVSEAISTCVPVIGVVCGIIEVSDAMDSRVLWKLQRRDEPISSLPNKVVTGDVEQRLAFTAREHRFE